MSSNNSIDNNSDNNESSIRRNDDGDIQNLRERLVSVTSSQDLSERARGPSVRTSAPALLLINADYDHQAMRLHGDTITQSGESTSESMSMYPESMPLLLQQNRRHNHNYTENEDRRLITRDQLVPPPMTPAKRAKMELSPAYSWFSLLENYSAYTIQNNSKDNKKLQEQNSDDNNQTSIILISNLHIQSAFTATSSTLPYCPQILPIIFTLLYRGLWLALSLYILIADYRIERVFHVDYYNPNHGHIFSKSYHWFLSLFDNDNHHYSNYGGGGGGHYHVHIEWNNVRRYYSHLTDCTTTLTVIYQICTCLLTIISALRLTISSIHNLFTTTCCTSRRKNDDEEDKNEDKNDEEEHDQYSRYQPNPFNVSSFIDSIEESTSSSSQYPKNANRHHHHNAKKEKIKQLTQTNQQPLSIESNQTGESKPGTLICLTWLLYSIVLPAEFIVSFGYWTFQRKHEDHALDFSDVYHHAIIAILLFIDGNIVGRIPLRLKHAIWLVTYEFIYLGWNLAYSLLDLGHDGGVVYDVLNWRHSPKIAISVSFFMMFVIGPFIFMFCWFFSIWSFNNCSFDGGRRFLVHYQYTKTTSCHDYVSADEDGIEENEEERRSDGWDRV